MKRAATHLFKRQSKNRAFFHNYRTFTPPPPCRPPGKIGERKPDPRGNQNMRIPGGRPGGWSGLELTDTLGGRFTPCIMCVQYRGGYSVPWGVFSTMGDIMSTVGGYLEYHGGVQYRGGYHDKCGGYLEYRGVFSTVGGYHEYHGGLS